MTSALLRLEPLKRGCSSTRFEGCLLRHSVLRPLATLHVFLALEVHAETRWQWFAEADGWERSTCWPLSSWPLQSCFEQVPEAGLVCSVKSSISITRNRLDVDDHFAVQLVKSGQVDDEKNNAAEEHLVFISSILGQQSVAGCVRMDDVNVFWIRG